MSKDLLSYFEAYILTKAREYANVEADIEDFQQEGRIAAWEALQEAHGLYGTKSYVYQRIDWRMLDYARKLYKTAEREIIGFNPQQENLLYGGGENFENYS